MRHTFPLLTLIALLTPHLHAADLTKIERSIRKEPTYQSKTPRYCLLVIGPEAKTRVWLILDGKTLYADRNANGDLTDEGEKITAKTGFAPVDMDLFEIEDIRDGARTHKNLRLYVRKLDYLAVSHPELKPKIAQLPEGCGYSLGLQVEMPGYKGKGAGGRIWQTVPLSDTRGFLTFADKPQNAPIIHFGGPWQIQCLPSDPLMVGRETDMYLSISTPGLGAGTTAHLLFEDTVPEKLRPRVEITYPPVRQGEAPLKRLYELKERC